MDETTPTASGSVPSHELVVLIPVYNDWDALRRLLSRLDEISARADLSPSILIVDDGSDTAAPASLGTQQYSAFGAIDVLVLRRNLGHQRAIAIGLAAAYDKVRPETVLVMDGDGEDAPEDVPRLLARLRETGGQRVVFAERRRRSESHVFRVGYTLYRLAHYLLTGIPVRVGNFSAIPAAVLERLVVVSELWNHYAAAVFRARVPRDSIPTVRAARLGGTPKMNFVGLVAHGLSALSVHAELIGVRLFVMALAIAFVAGTALFVGLAAHGFAVAALPTWVRAGTGVLLVLLSQAVALAIVFVFLVLHGRSQPLFIPIRDYTYFVSRLLPVFRNGRRAGAA